MNKYSKNDILLRIKNERKIKYIICLISLIIIGIILWKIEDYSLMVIFERAFIPILFFVIVVIGIMGDNKAIKYYENNQQEKI
ncbi:hypothetical protein YZ31_07545 [Campylobacter lari]|nr:hypothetical protein [Campylobacter lari]